MKTTISIVSHEVEKILPQIQTIRHHLHAHPELALQEFNTSAYIRSQLGAQGINTADPLLDTDVVAMIAGTETGNNVTLRADMDALPLQEMNLLDYGSTIPGRMHACGHDGHCAMLLGAAFVLNNLRHRFRGSVRLVFQPGEEVVAAGKDLVAAGALENPKPDAVLALHAWTGLPVGAIGAKPGAAMAAADFFKIIIQGRGGHGSKPERTIDPILIATRVVESLYAIPSRHIGALDPVVISVCSIHGGQSANVIPDEVVLEGSIRYFSKEAGEKLPVLFDRIVRGECDKSGASAIIDYKRPYIPTINNPDIVAIGKEVVERCLGSHAWIDVTEPSMGSEDFSYFLGNNRGAMFLLGMGEESPQLHNNCFNFNDDALKNGIQFLVLAALELLHGGRSQLHAAAGLFSTASHTTLGES
jgi:amidohydrolase